MSIIAGVMYIGSNDSGHRRHAAGRLCLVGAPQVMFMLLTAMWASQALADGKSFGRDMTGWRSLDELEQRAFIACDGVNQRMIVSISVDPANVDSALWLLPIKVPAERVKLDLVDAIPRPQGIDPRVGARRFLENIAIGMRLTQLYAIVADGCLLPTLNRADSGITSTGGVDRFGLHSEIITADSLEALRAYLKSKSTELPADALDSFLPYFDGQHCVVATWVTDPAAVRETVRRRDARTLAVVVDFPSTKPWYPMRATSGYGTLRIRVNLYVKGLVKVDDPGGVRDIRTRYYRERRPADGTIDAAWTGGGDGDFEYTLISFDDPADRYTTDFTFSPTVPRNWALASHLEAIAQRRWLAFMVGFIIVMGALALAGALAAGLLKQPMGTGALVGMTGLATILVVSAALREIQSADVQSLRNAGRGSFGFRAIYSIIVVVISVILTNLARALTA